MSNIATDGAGVDSGIVTSTNTLSWAHAPSVSSDGILWAAYVIQQLSGTDSDITSSVTFNSVAMSRATRVQRYVASPYEYTVELFSLLAPASGSHSIVVTLTGSAVAIYGASMAYTGAKQSGVPDATQTKTDASVTTQTVTLTTVADRCWTILFTRNDTGILVAGTGSTERVNPTIYGLFDSGAPITPAGSTSQAVNISSGSSAIMSVMASFAPNVVTGGALLVKN